MPTPGSGTNQIVPFATGVGANVETAVDWAADTVRQQGFQAGTASSQQANTVLRQASFIASVLAQFMADYSENDTNDDGDVITAEENLILALTKLFAPFGVYFIQDTGTGNDVVGTSDPAPAAYSAPGLVVFKKSNTDNAGAMTANFWTLGAVSLTDNTGANFAASAIKANSYYIAAFSGGGYRVLGGATTYTNVSNLTANSGDGVEVTVGGVVNRRTLLGTHDTNVGNGDRWPRGRSADDHDIYMTTTELIAWLNSVLSFLTTIPPTGFGPAVGQFITTGAGGSLGATPSAHGYTIGMTASGANLAAGTVPGITCQQFRYSASLDNGYWNGTTPTGTWQLVEHSWNNNAGYVTIWDLRWKRIA